MTYDNLKSELGRQPISIIEMDLGFCFKNYGESHTNLALWSEDFTNAAWGSVGVTGEKDPRAGANAQLLDGEIAIQTVTVADDSVSRTFSVFLAQVTGATSEIKIVYTGGTGIGETNIITWPSVKGEVPTVSNGTVTAPNDFPYGLYRVDVTLANNSSGNTSCVITVDQSTDTVIAFGGMLSTTGGHYVKTTTTSATGACTAALASGLECFNTRQTCQDDPNFDSRIRTYRFSQDFPNRPIGIPMINSISGNVSRAATSTTAGKGLGNRGLVMITLEDHTWHDRDVDPYFATRSYDPDLQGTYWGKFISRNPFYEQREIRVYSGYVDVPWSWDNFQVELYDIVDITGPTNGKVGIKAKDILARTYGKTNQYPVANNGQLLAAITDVATSATLTPTGIGNSEYSASGYLAIGKEICSFTRAADVLTLVREQWGTTAKTQAINSAVQECITWDGVNVVDVLDELMITGISINPDYIPYDNGATGNNESWDDEKDLWLSSASVTGILMKPEPIEKVIAELSGVFLFDIWWDAETSEVRIKALSPEASGVTINTLNDDTGLVADSIRISRNSGKRVSQVWVYYNKLDYSEKNSPEQFAQGFISIDVAAEGADKYGTVAQRVIMSRWFNGEGQASILASRAVARFSKTPIEIEFENDLKDSAKLSMAERIQLDTKYIQDEFGLNLPTNFQITGIKEGRQGQTQIVKGIESHFAGRYVFIGPNGTPDYSSATEDEQEAIGFISAATSPFFPDNSQFYKII